MRPVREELVEAYDDYADDVYGYFIFRLVPPVMAEELTGRAFERAFEIWGTLDRGRLSARAWLLAIAHDLYVDHRRRNPSPHEGELDEQAVTEPSPASGDSRREALGVEPELAAALRRLSRREREALALCFGGDLALPELATLLGVEPDEGKKYLARGLRGVAAALEPRAAAPSPPGDQ